MGYPDFDISGYIPGDDEESVLEPRKTHDYINLITRINPWLMDCELFVIFDSIYDSSNITYANTLVLRLCKLTKNCNNDALVTLSSLKIQEPISSTYIQIRIRELWIWTVLLPSHLLWSSDSRSLDS